MNLTKEEISMLDGDKGPVLQKIIETVVEYGEIFDATHLAPLDHGAHMVMGFGLKAFEPMYEIMKEITDAEITSPFPFTVNPRTDDFKGISVSFLEKILFKIMYPKQKFLEGQYRRLGLKDDNAFTCTSFLPEINNLPERGQVVAAAESMVVLYVNSILGARTHRNAGGMELIFSALGKVPVFGYITDDGRKADCLLKVECTALPDPQILGSIVGDLVIEKTPYITGLDSFINLMSKDERISYLKEMCCLASTTGAMGLMHVEGVTPEALDFKKNLLRKNFKEFSISDKMINNYSKGFPVLWKDPFSKPQKAFIGCPHLTVDQLIQWSKKINSLLNETGNDKVKLETVFFAAPDIIKCFKENTVEFNDLIKSGASLSSSCPNLYMANPLAQKKPVVTNSNKHRIYSTSRYFNDEDILGIIVSGNLPEAGQ